MSHYIPYPLTKMNITTFDTGHWIHSLPDDLKLIINTLNEQQCNALGAIVEWYRHSTYCKYKLTGYAGSGKTYLAAIILKVLLHFYPRTNILCIAPNHKAKRQLAASLKNQQVPANYATVSSFLGKIPELDIDTGREEFTSNMRKPNINVLPDVIVCDEYGMIGFDDACSLLHGQNDIKILFLGDNAQLPPIGEEESTIDAHTLTPESLLTKVVRYDGELLEVANSYNIRKKLVPIVLQGSSMDGSIIQLSSRKKFVETYVKHSLIAASTQNWNFTKLICYTNKQCELYNEWVHELMFETDVPYLTGDRLIALKPLFRQNDALKFNIAVESSMEFVVTSYVGIETLIIDDQAYEYHSVFAIADTGLSIRLQILTADYIGQRSLHRDKAKKVKNWKVVAMLDKLFDNISYAYAITCHKAQGSTYDFCFVDLVDLFKCNNLKRIVYTAITRTKTSMFYY